jgi:hypothetical protein
MKTSHKIEDIMNEVKESWLDHIYDFLDSGSKRGSLVALPIPIYSNQHKKAYIFEVMIRLTDKDYWLSDRDSNLEDDYVPKNKKGVQ